MLWFGKKKTLHLNAETHAAQEKMAAALMEIEARLVSDHWDLTDGRETTMMVYRVGNEELHVETGRVGGYCVRGAAGVVDRLAALYWESASHARL